MPSEAVTRNIRVRVETSYAPSRSNPEKGVWFFLYTIRLTNEGPETVLLVSRHWIITDALGRVEDVHGPGVVGEHPLLTPGDSFEYTSGCPLRTPFGSMRGTYQMVNEEQQQFDIEIPSFELMEPYSTVH